MRALGYKTVGGRAEARLSALRRYGLIEGGKGVRLSSLATQILRYAEGSEEYLRAVRIAALKPELFQEIIVKHENASYDALCSYLKSDRGFSERSARLFLAAFRETVSIARLDQARGDGNVEGDLAEGLAERASSQWQAVDDQEDRRTYLLRLPLDSDLVAEVRIMGKDVRREHIERLRDYLQLAKRAFSRSDHGQTH